MIVFRRRDMEIMSTPLPQNRSHLLFFYDSNNFFFYIGFVCLDILNIFVS